MNCQFSFDPDGSYFCSAGSAFKWGEHNLPVEFARLLQNRNDPHALQTPYDIAFPPSEPGMFAGCWKSVSGEDRFYVPGNYMRLARLIKSVGANFADGQATRTVFGQGSSFFSMSPKGYAWKNLPEALEDDMNHSMRIRRPICVALGYQKAYVVLYTDGNVIFDLRGYYPAVEAMIRKTQEATRRGGLTYVSLNSHVPDEFYAAFSDGSAMWNLPRAWNENVMFVSRHIKPVAKPPVAASPGGTASTQFPGVSAAPGGTAPSLAMDGSAESVGEVPVSHPVPVATDAPATSPGGTTPVLESVPAAPGGTAPSPMVDGSTDSVGGVSIGYPVPVATDTPATSISPGGTPAHFVESVPAAPGSTAPSAMPDSGLDLGGDSIGHAVPIASPIAAVSSGGMQPGAVQSFTVAPGGSAPSLTSIGGMASNDGVSAGQTAPVASPGPSQFAAVHSVPSAAGGTAPSPALVGVTLGDAVTAPPNPSAVRTNSASAAKPKLGWRQGVTMGIKAARGLNNVVNVVQNPNLAVNNVVNAVQNPTASLNNVVNAVQNSNLATATAGQLLNNAENALIQQVTSQQNPPASPGPSQFVAAIGNSVAAAGAQSPPSSPSTFRATGSSSKSPKLGWRQGVAMGITAARGLNKAINVVEVAGQQTPPANQGGQMLENMENTLIQQVLGQQTPPANAQVNQ
ncbi:hypothetical protein B0H11DRAFT_1907368 [Mycena galericulata]|nr:hypothetical protein B0H11DRAFT_1907368 [Mycena galericulata]